MYGWGGWPYRGWAGRVCPVSTVGKVDPVAVLRKYGKLPPDEEEVVVEPEV